MKTKQSIVVILALGVGFATGVWMGGDHGTGHEATEAATYRCPMHPTVVSERPGSCPICGMDLVADKTHGEAHVSGERKMESGRGVKIDPATVQNIGVKTAVVERQPLVRTVRTVGRVDYDETRMTDVNTKVTGWVERLFVDYTGQMVKKGQPLLEIYSPELVAAQEEYLTALDYNRRLMESASEEIAAGALDLLRSARQRLLYWDITEEQIAELERTRQVKRTMTLHSPQQGVVVHKDVFDGAHIKAGQHLYRIADLSRVWVYAHIYEYELPWIKMGQEAEVELSYEPGKTFRGKVTYVYPFLESKTRTVKVRMVFPNPGIKLKPEMYANVKIKPVVSRNAVVVPTQAVIRSGTRNVVILDLGEGRFLPREVVLGVEAEGVTEAIKGLAEGDRIVTSAQFLIDSESHLKAALATMGGDRSEAGHQH